MKKSIIAAFMVAFVAMPTYTSLGDKATKLWFGGVVTTYVMVSLKAARENTTTINAWRRVQAQSQERFHDFAAWNDRRVVPIIKDLITSRSPEER